MQYLHFILLTGRQIHQMQMTMCFDSLSSDLATVTGNLSDGYILTKAIVVNA